MVLSEAAVAHLGIEQLALQQVLHHHVAHACKVEGEARKHQKGVGILRADMADERQGQHRVLFGIEFALYDALPYLGQQRELLPRALRRLPAMRKDGGQMPCKGVFVEEVVPLLAEGTEAEGEAERRIDEARLQRLEQRLAFRLL